MSLPSIIMSCFVPIFLCISTSFSRTALIAETCDTILVTSLLLIFSDTSSPFNKTICFLFVSFISIFIVFSISFICLESFKLIFLFRTSNVTERYIAPVSILFNFNFWANFFVIVPFPLPAGPSIATIKAICSSLFFKIIFLYHYL